MGAWVSVLSSVVRAPSGCLLDDGARRAGVALAVESSCGVPAEHTSQRGVGVPVTDNRPLPILNMAAGCCVHWFVLPVVSVWNVVQRCRNSPDFPDCMFLYDCYVVAMCLLC